MSRRSTVEVVQSDGADPNDPNTYRVMKMAYGKKADLVPLGGDLLGLGSGQIQRVSASRARSRVIGFFLERLYQSAISAETSLPWGFAPSSRRGPGRRPDFVPVGQCWERVMVCSKKTAWSSVRRLCLILRVVQWLGLVVFGWASVWSRR